jgi:spore coat protein CotH
MHRLQRRASAVILVALLVTTLLVPLSSLDGATIWMDSTPATAYVTNVFDDTMVATVSIDMSASNWQWLLDNARQEEFRSCDITINGTTYHSVGIRPKGNSSLARVASSTSDRFSFKVKFDEYIPGQTCYGLRALVLNNVMDDATYMKEYLSYKLFRDMGIATPAFSYASITVNGKPWGLYLMVEVIDSSFAQRNYGTTSGNLYKPESVNVGARGKFVADQADDQPAVQDGARAQGGGMRGAGGTSLAYTSDAASDYSVLRDSAVLSTTDDQDFQNLITMMKALKNGTGIEETLDVDEVLRYFAVNTFLVNLDSYASSLKHNYYLYEQDGIFQILPWDLNLSFAGFQAGSAASAINFPIDTPVSDTMDNSPLIASLLAVDEYRELYHSYLQQLVVQEIRSGAFEAEVARVNALIAGAVKSDATAFVTYEQYQASLPVLIQFAQDRASSIMAQLAGQQPTTTTGTLATTVNLATLGSQAGGANMAAPEQAGAAPNARVGQPDGAAPVGGVFGGAQVDRTVMQQALAIIRAAAADGLTDEQTAQLTELGLDAAAIERLQQMPSAGQRPGIPADPAQAAPGTVAQGASDSVLPLLAVTSAGLLLLVAGIVFVARFRNRRYLTPA